MSSLHKLKDMICDAIDAIAEQGELTLGSLQMVDQLTHSLKSIDTIIAMEGGDSKATGNLTDKEKESLKSLLEKMKG